jgi:hypothetical protein
MGLGSERAAFLLNRLAGWKKTCRRTRQKVVSIENFICVHVDRKTAHVQTISIDGKVIDDFEISAAAPRSRPITSESNSGNMQTQQYCNTSFIQLSESSSNVALCPYLPSHRAVCLIRWRPR